MAIVIARRLVNIYIKFYHFHFHLCLKMGASKVNEMGVTQTNVFEILSGM